MSPRIAAWLAWSLWALSVMLTALSLLLLVSNLTQPNTHIYNTWLDNTLNAVCFSTVGAFVASRRPENLVGWLLCLFALSESIQLFGGEYAIYALLAHPNSLPAGEAMAWIVSWTLPIIIGLSVFYILLFPTGRLPSRRWRWVGWRVHDFHSLDISHAYLHRDSNFEISPLRHRPPHKPHPRLRCAHGHAGAGVLRGRDGHADDLPGAHRPRA